MRKYSSDNHSDTVFDNELRSWSTAEDILYRGRDLTQRWAALAPSDRSQKNTQFLYFIGFLRAGRHEEARVAGEPFFKTETTLRWLLPFSSLLCSIIVLGDRYKLESLKQFVFWILFQLTSRVTALDLFALTYYKMWSKQDEGLLFATLFYAHSERSKSPDIPRAKWFFGFLAALNGWYDLGHRYVSSGVREWEQVESPLHDMWLGEGLIVRSATEYFIGETDSSLASFAEAAKLLQNGVRFPFAIIYGLSVRLRTSLKANRPDVFHESLNLLKAILGNLYDSRFALRAHSFSALFSALEGNTFDAFKELSFADSFVSRTPFVFEQNYHFVQKSRVYLSVGLVNRALENAKKAVAGFETCADAGIGTLEARLQEARCLLAMKVIGLKVSRADRKSFNTVIRKLETLAARGASWAPIVSAYEKMFSIAGELEYHSFVESIDSVVALPESEKHELGLALRVHERLHDREQTVEEIIGSQAEFSRVQQLLFDYSNELARIQVPASVIGSLSKVLSSITQIDLTPQWNLKDFAEITEEHADGRDHSNLVNFGISVRTQEGQACFALDSVPNIKFYRNKLGGLVFAQKLSQARIDELHRTSESERMIRLRAVEEMSSQVSHDIRSPLSALNMVVNTLDSLPEEKRKLIRQAIQRINDIANGLLAQSRKSSLQEARETVNESNQKKEPTMLTSVLDSIVSEKRLQYRDRMDLEIQGDFTEGYGLFADLHGPLLARVLSNLINNSVEAIDGRGLVRISLKNDGDKTLLIQVMDTGRGIPPEVLERLGEKGISHGKSQSTESGNGLGVYYAKNVIESAGGSLTFDSKLGRGTKISIRLPKAIPPVWYFDRLVLTSSTKIVSVDDDQTIHQIWAGRLGSAMKSKNRVDHLTFSSLDAFESWFKTNDQCDSVFFIDYEFIGQRLNGLDAIAALGIQDRAILTTSRFEEPALKQKAKELSVKILPKIWASSLPIAAPSSIAYDAVLIDDDPLVHLTWQLKAKADGRKLLCFVGSDDFFEEAEKIDKASPIFIDVNLGKMRGQDLAQQAFDAGFSNIALATGYDAGEINVPSFITRVVGKDPVFA